MGRKIYLIAGEASGDLHGGNLIRAMRTREADLEIRGWGGDQMEAAGCQLVRHYRDLAFMGFVEVIRNLPTILGNLRLAKRDIREFRPDIVVFIDYPGFNLRLVPYVKSLGIRTVYYISPQLWAWHESRVKIIRHSVDDLLVILPFEAGFFAQEGVQASYVGHPLVEVIRSFQSQVDIHQALDLSPDRPLIALLPGSRRQEVTNMLPVMAALARQYPRFAWVIAEAPGLSEATYRQVLADYPEIHSIRGRTYDLLAQAYAAVVTSGTATLETALFQVPQVVAYKGSVISYWIARQLVKLKYISLVNLLLDRPLVKELIQQDLTIERLKQAFQDLLDPPTRQAMLEGYTELRKLLGEQDASASAAGHILND